MAIIDNNKKLSGTEERDILDIMTSSDEKAKIDLLKLRVLVERNNDFSVAVMRAFRNDEGLKSKAEQVKQLLFQSPVRGNGALREYKKRAGTDSISTTDSEYISILQAGMITCEDIQCSDERDLLTGHRGERTATHKTKYAVDAALGPNTFNKMMTQIKNAGYEGKKIENMSEMLHILLDFMIKTIMPFAQGKEVIPTLSGPARNENKKKTKTSPSTPKNDPKSTEPADTKGSKDIQVNHDKKDEPKQKSANNKSTPIQTNPGQKEIPKEIEITPISPIIKSKTPEKGKESEAKKPIPKRITNVETSDPTIVTIDFCDTVIEGGGKGSISSQVTYDFLTQQGRIYNTLPDKRRGEAACSGYAQRLLIGQFGIAFLREAGLLPEKKKSGEALCDAWQITRNIEKSGLGMIYGDLTSKVKVGQKSIAWNNDHESIRKSLIETASTPEARNGFVHLHNAKTSNRDKVQSDKDPDTTPNTHTSYVMGTRTIESKAGKVGSLGAAIVSSMREHISSIGGRNTTTKDRLHLVKYLKNVTINGVTVSYSEKQKDFVDTKGNKVITKVGDTITYDDTMIAHYVNNKPQIHGLIELTIGSVYTPIQGIQRDTKKVPQRNIDYKTNKSLDQFMGKNAIYTLPQDIAYTTAGKNNPQLESLITKHYKTIYKVHDDKLCIEYTKKTIDYLVQQYMRNPNMTLRRGDRILIPDRRYDPDPKQENPFECLDILSKPLNIRTSLNEGEWMAISMGHAGKEGISRRAKTQMMMLQFAVQEKVTIPSSFQTEEDTEESPVYTLDGDFGPQSYGLMESILATYGYAMSKPRNSNEKLRITQSDIALFHKIYDKYYTGTDKKSGRFLCAEDIKDPRYVFRDAKGDSLPGVYRGLHSKIISDDLFSYHDTQGKRRTEQANGDFLTSIIDNNPFWQKTNTNVRNKVGEDFGIIMEELNKLLSPELDRTPDGQPTPNNMIKAQIISTYLLETGTKEGLISGEVIKEWIASILGMDRSTGPYEHQPRVVANLMIKYGNGAFLEELGIPRAREGRDPHDPAYSAQRAAFLDSPTGQEALDKIKVGVRDLHTATKLVYLGRVDRIRNENNLRHFIRQQNNTLPPPTKVTTSPITPTSTPISTPDTLPPQPTPTLSPTTPNDTLPTTPSGKNTSIDRFGNMIKSIQTIAQLPLVGRTDATVYEAKVGKLVYLFYSNGRCYDGGKNKMVNRSKDSNGILTVDGIVVNPPLRIPPSSGGASQDSLPPQTATPDDADTLPPADTLPTITPETKTTPTDTLPSLSRKERETARIDMLSNAKVEAWALAKAGVEIDEKKISYTKLAATINSIPDTSLRKEMIRRVVVDSKDNQGNIVSKALRMQELFGMKSRPAEDTFYQANTIQEKVNTISLTRFARPNRVRWDKEQIELSAIPTDVKESYQKFYDGVLPSNNLPYCIISKTNGCIYLFTADHHLVAAQPVLLGKEKGDTYRGKDLHINTTPPGQYQIASKRSTAEKYGDPGHCSILAPMEDQYHIWIDANGHHDSNKGVQLLIHSSVDPTVREPLFDPSIPLDQRRVSDGCINISRQTYDEFFDHIAYHGNKNIGSTVYITPEQQSSPVVV